MLRTPPKALSLALLLGSTACAAAPRVPTAPAPTARAQAPERIEETFTPPPAAAAPVRRDLLGSVRYDLPVEANRWVEMELDFLVKQRHAVIGRWLQRSEKYDDWVQEVFAAHGIPRDLHHLAMVESGYSPTARSHAGALGMWQFMPATGRSMGLRIDDVVDERMDPVRATYAAARHLRDLHRGFRGDWALAAAAYNAGATRINRGLGRYNARNFWELSERGDLAQETRHYVPRLFAVTIIGRDPARFGYPARSALVRRFHYDSVKVDIETPVAELAKIGNIPATALAELNPHLHRGIAPARYTVWAPGGSGRALQAAFDSSEFRRSGGYGWYTLRRGENAASVASAAGIPADRIRELNLSVAVDRIGAGTRVRLPAPSVALLNSRPVVRADTIDELEAARRASRESRAARSAEARRQTEERRAAAREADRAESAARAARRAVADSVERAASAERRAARAARAEEERSARPTESTPARPASRPAESASRTHTVEEGETVRGLARVYEVSAESIREANDLGAEQNTLRAGRTLRIPRAGASAASTTGRPASTAARPAAESSFRTHTVEEGETVRGLARVYEVAAAAIREANDLGAEANTLRAGRKLRIPRASSAGAPARDTESAPARSASRPAESTSRTHTVEEGETVRGLARVYEVSAESIREANDLGAEQNTLRAGRTLRIPRASSSASTPARSTTGTPARSTASTRTHTVEEGETVRGLARVYEVSADAIREANDLDADANTLRAGRTLRIPRAGAPAASTSSRPTTTASRTAAERARAETTGRTHTVEEGETVRGLARVYEVSAESIREANDLGAETNTLRAGRKLRIPRADDAPRASTPARSTAARDTASRGSTPSRSTAARDTASRARSSTATRRPAASTTEEHVVKTGDTLYSLARRYGTTVAALRSANDLDEDDAIQPGQKLRVPRS